MFGAWILCGILLLLIFAIVVAVSFAQEDKQTREKFEFWWVENFEKEQNYTPTEKIVMAKRRREAWELYLSRDLRI